MVFSTAALASIRRSDTQVISIGARPATPGANTGDAKRITGADEAPMFRFALILVAARKSRSGLFSVLV